MTTCIKKTAGKNKETSYILCNEGNIRALVLRKETMYGNFPMNLLEVLMGIKCLPY